MYNNTSLYKFLLFLHSQMYNNKFDTKLPTINTKLSVKIKNIYTLINVKRLFYSLINNRAKVKVHFINIALTHNYCIPILLIVTFISITFLIFCRYKLINNLIYLVTVSLKGKHVFLN